MSSRREKENIREAKIKKEAKLILDKFAKALSAVEEIPDSFVERDENRREEKEGREGDSKFREIFFENAPETKKQCILAERGKWK